MTNILTTPPAITPVTVAQQKIFMRLESDAEDDFIELLIQSATQFVELETRLALIEQEWTLTFDRIPIGPNLEEEWWDGTREGAIGELNKLPRSIELPTGPLMSVTSFTTYDQADAGTVFTGFYTDTGARPGRVSLRNGQLWPIPTRGTAGVVIVYKAGFGAAAANVPADLRIAVQQIASHWYENREILTFETSARDVPTGAAQILKRRKVRKI